MRPREFQSDIHVRLDFFGTTSYRRLPCNPEPGAYVNIYVKRFGVVKEAYENKVTFTLADQLTPGFGKGHNYNYAKMISEESLRLYSYVIRYGYWSRLFPYKWNQTTYRMRLVANLNRWKLFSILSLTGQWAFVFMIFVAWVDLGFQFADTISLIYVTLGQSFSTVIQMYNLVLTQEFAALISTALSFVRRLAELYDLDTNGKDGTEGMTRVLQIGRASCRERV